MKDYLKYWRVVRYWAKVKWNIQEQDLDILLLIYSEKYFSREMFDGIESCVKWDRNRMERLIQNGFVGVVQEKPKKLFAITPSAKAMVTIIYKKLEGEEISENPDSNEIFARKVPYSHKVYRRMIENMNVRVRQRHLSRRSLGTEDPES
jgi:hypothetical protein